MQKHIDKLGSLMSAEGSTAITQELLATLRDMDGKLDGLGGKIQSVEKEVAVISAHVEENKALQARVHQLELALAKLDPDRIQTELKAVTETGWKLQIKMAGWSAVSATGIVGIVELVKLLSN